MTRRPLLTVLAFLFVLAACAPNRGAAYDKAVAEARRAHHAGRFAEAAVRFDEAARTAKVPRDAVYARYEAALARARAGDVARASRELAAIAEAEPPTPYSAQASFKNAELVLRNDEARGYEALEATALRFPSTGVARVALQRVVRHEDRASGVEASLAHLERLRARTDATPLAEVVHYERALRLAELGRHEEARDAYLEIARRWPYPFGVYFDDSLYRASEMEEKLGRPREAIPHLERLLSFRETSDMMGSYERPRYVPAIFRIADLWEKLGDRPAARAALHRMYVEFKHSTLRDDALWREAALFRKDGDGASACNRLATLTADFPDSRYVPCAALECPAIRRPKNSKAPTSCRGYLLRAQQP